MNYIRKLKTVFSSRTEDDSKKYAKEKEFASDFSDSFFDEARLQDMYQLESKDTSQDVSSIESCELATAVIVPEILEDVSTQISLENLNISSSISISTNCNFTGVAQAEDLECTSIDTDSLVDDSILEEPEVKLLYQRKLMVFQSDTKDQSPHNNVPSPNDVKDVKDEGRSLNVKDASLPRQRTKSILKSHSKVGEELALRPESKHRKTTLKTSNITGSTKPGRARLASMVQFKLPTSAALDGSSPGESKQIPTPKIPSRLEDILSDSDADLLQPKLKSSSKESILRRYSSWHHGMTISEKSDSLIPQKKMKHAIQWDIQKEGISEEPFQYVPKKRTEIKMESPKAPEKKIEKPQKEKSTKRTAASLHKSKSDLFQKPEKQIQESEEESAPITREEKKLLAKKKRESQFRNVLKEVAQQLVQNESATRSSLNDDLEYDLDDIEDFTDIDIAQGIAQKDKSFYEHVSSHLMSQEQGFVEQWLTKQLNNRNVASSTRSITSSMVDTAENISEFSLTADILVTAAVKRRKCQVRKTIIDMPVNLIAAQLEMKELANGNLRKIRMDEMSRITKVNFFGTLEDRRIKFRHKLISAILKFIRYGPKKVMYLKDFEFIMMLLFNEINVFQMQNEIDAVLELGPVIGILLKLLQVVCLDAPMMMFIVGLCSYSKFMNFKIFKAMPIIKGLAFGIFVVYIFEMGKHSINLENICYLNLYSAIDRGNWMTCTFNNELETQFCIPSHTNQTHNSGCEEPHVTFNGYKMFSTQYMYYKLSVEDFGWRLSASAVSWILVFVAVMIGFQQTKGFYIYLQVYNMIPISLMGMWILATNRCWQNVHYNWYPIQKFFKPQLMINLLSKAAKFQNLPYLAWVSVMKPRTMDPEVAVMWVMTVKMVIVLFGGLILQATCLSAITTYKIETKCFVITATEAILIMVPEYFLRYEFGYMIMSVWISSIMFSVHAFNVFNVQASIESLFQGFPKLLKIPFATTLAVCSTLLFLQGLKAIGIHTGLTALNFLERFITLKGSLFAWTIFLIALKFLYTWERFRDDFFLSYKRKPSRYWRIWLNVVAYFSLVSKTIFKII